MTIRVVAISLLCDITTENESGFCDRVILWPASRCNFTSKHMPLGPHGNAGSPWHTPLVSSSRCVASIFMTANKSALPVRLFLLGCCLQSHFLRRAKCTAQLNGGSREQAPATAPACVHSRAKRESVWHHRSKRSRYFYACCHSSVCLLGKHFNEM